MEREIFGDASQIVQCGSRLVAREIAERFGVPAERLRVITNGVDLERFQPPAQRPRAGLGGPPGGVTAFALGRFRVAVANVF